MLSHNLFDWQPQIEGNEMSAIVADDRDLEIPPFPVRRWTVEQYELIARLGILDEDDQLELLDGWIVPKTTKNPRHDATLDVINQYLLSLLPHGWFVRIQNVLLTPDSAPEPDITVVAGKPRDYMARHPTGNDLALVIEVADTSVDRDRLKRRIYARAGVSNYWIVNLVENQIEAHTGIIGTGRDTDYRDMSVIQVEDRISFELPRHRNIVIAVADLLP